MAGMKALPMKDTYWHHPVDVQMPQAATLTQPTAEQKAQAPYTAPPRRPVSANVLPSLKLLIPGNSEPFGQQSSAHRDPFHHYVASPANATSYNLLPGPPLLSSLQAPPVSELPSEFTR